MTSPSTFGDVVDVYTGLDLTATVRLGNGGQASGGVSLGRERTDYCDIAPYAQIGTNTDTTAGKILATTTPATTSTTPGGPPPASRARSTARITPYQADWKALVSYPLGLNASATWQNRVGPQILASYVVSATSQTTLGRTPTFNTASARI